jgi:branched-chain amino acid transport system substrate-binding protein
MGRKVLVIGLCLGVLAAAAGFAGGQAESKSVLYLGLAAPLTGDSAMYGETVRNGVLFAVDEINAAGGIQGKKIEVVIQDDKGDPKEAALVAQKLAEDKRLFAIIGHVNSSCTLAALPIYKDAGLTVLNTSSSAEKITQLGYKHFFRSVIHDGLQGPFLVQHAVKNLGHKRLAAMVANSDYGLGLLTSVKATAKKFGAEVVAAETYVPSQDKDFNPQLAKIKTANPDAMLILGDYNEAGLIIRQMKTMGLDIDRVTPAACSNVAMIELAGADAAEGTFMLGYWDPDRPTPVVQNFVKAYKAKKGEIPDEREAYGYEIPYILKMAIEKGATKATLPDVLRTIEFNGPTGFTKYDANGDVSEKMQMVFVVKNGNFASWMGK